MDEHFSQNNHSLSNPQLCILGKTHKIPAKNEHRSQKILILPETKNTGSAKLDNMICPPSNAINSLIIFCLSKM